MPRVMGATGLASIIRNELWKNVRDQATLIFTFNKEDQGILRAQMAPMAVRGERQTKCGTEGLQST